jgi:hypothetical protein
VVKDRELVEMRNINSGLEKALLGANEKLKIREEINDQLMKES